MAFPDKVSEKSQYETLILESIRLSARRLIPDYEKFGFLSDLELQSRIDREGFGLLMALATYVTVRWEERLVTDRITVPATWRDAVKEALHHSWVARWRVGRWMIQGWKPKYRTIETRITHNYYSVCPHREAPRDDSLHIQYLTQSPMMMWNRGEKPNG